MLIKEIEPIDKPGINLLKEYDAKSIIDQIVELPLRKPCKILLEKGIHTMMSSANKTNVLKNGEKPIEKEDIYNSVFDMPLFTEAGKGYAWIMLDFESLSDENKDFLFSMEERKDQNGNKVGEKAIWFAHPFEVGSIEYGLRIGKYTYEELKECIPEDQIPANISLDERLVEFEKRHIVLVYYPDIGSTQAVILRMPINEQTTVQEVEEYFSNFALNFKNQMKKAKQIDER